MMLKATLSATVLPNALQGLLGGAPEGCAVGLVDANKPVGSNLGISLNVTCSVPLEDRVSCQRWEKQQGQVRPLCLGHKLVDFLGKTVELVAIWHPRVGLFELP